MFSVSFEIGKWDSPQHLEFLKFLAGDWYKNKFPEPIEPFRGEYEVMVAEVTPSAGEDFEFYFKQYLYWLCAQQKEDGFTVLKFGKNGFANDFLRRIVHYLNTGEYLAKGTPVNSFTEDTAVLSVKPKPYRPEVDLKQAAENDLVSLMLVDRNNRHAKPIIIRNIQL